MSLCRRCSLIMLAFGIAAVVASNSFAEPIPEKYQKHINKGLEWLKKTQAKDGSWSANGQNPVAMTSLAGLAMLMEGSTINQGKYADNIKRAAEFLMARSMKTPEGRNGLIGNPDHPGEAGRYMYGHGFAMLFLGSVYGEETDKEQRDKLKDILTRAVRYCGKAQSYHKERELKNGVNVDVEFGGWFYTSAFEGHNSDEGSVTVTQMQGMRACRDAGIPVPKEIMLKGYNYLRKSTTAQGGVIYSYARGGVGGPLGGERPALTAAAIACLFSAGKYEDKLIKDWFKFCHEHPRGIRGGGGRFGVGGHDEYTHFYYAPSVYFLGDDGWEKMFPGTKKKDALTWTWYRNTYFDSFCRAKSADGSFGGQGGWSPGAVYSTAVFLTILQLDNNCLPVFQR